MPSCPTAWLKYFNGIRSSEYRHGTNVRHMNYPAMETKPKLVHAAALLTLAWFFLNTILPAWSQPSSDFPNYYTAAKLARERSPLHLLYEWTWFQREIHYAGIDG